MSKFSFILLFVFIASTYSLHLKMHLAIANYIAEVKETYTSAGNIFDDLLDVYENIMTKNNDQGTSLDDKIAAIDPLFTQQIEKITELEKLLAKPINQSQWACNAISDQQRQAVDTTIGEVQASILKLESTVDNLTDTHQNDQVSDTIQILNTQLQRTSKTLYAVGQPASQVDEPQTVYRTNLMSNNWIRNGVNIKDIQYISSQKIIQVCDIQKPYYNTIECSDCTEQPNIYYDLKQNKCVSCKNFDAQNHQCLDTHGSNLQVASNRVILPEDKTLQDYKSDIPCPEQKPFYDGKECIGCEQPQKLFDLQNKTCTQCKQNQKYSQQNHRCIRITKYFTNIENQQVLNRLILPNNLSITNVEGDRNQLKKLYNVVGCPDDTPFKSQTECISCSGLFNYESKQCGECEQHRYYDENQHHCLPIPYYTNLDSVSNWVITEKTQNTIRNQLKEASQKKFSEACPSDNPYFNGKECISCDSDKFFDMQNLSCRYCQQQHYFNDNTHKCQKIYQKRHQTNPDKAPNLIYAQKSYNYWMREYYSNLVDDELLPDCPNQSPYWSDKSCIICPESRPYFNMKTKKCQKCADGYTYNDQKHECISQSGQIQQ